MECKMLRKTLFMLPTYKLLMTFYKIPQYFIGMNKFQAFILQLKILLALLFSETVVIFKKFMIMS